MKEYTLTEIQQKISNKKTGKPISRRTLIREIDAKRLKAEMKSGTYFIKEKDLERFIQYYNAVDRHPGRPPLYDA